LHSSKSGLFEQIIIPDKLKENICDKIEYFKKGDRVNVYRNSRDVIGVIIFAIPQNKINYYLKQLHKNSWVKLSKDD
jgi:hypothetical protein